MCCFYCRFQNACLYFWGSAFNLAVMIANDGTTIADKGLFHDYNGFSVANIFITAVVGLSVAGM